MSIDLINANFARKKTLQALVKKDCEKMSRIARICYEITGRGAMVTAPGGGVSWTPLKDLEHGPTVAAVEEYDPATAFVGQWTPSEEADRRARAFVRREGSRMSNPPIQPVVETFRLHSEVLGLLDRKGKILTERVLETLDMYDADPTDMIRLIADDSEQPLKRLVGEDSQDGGHQDADD